MFGGDEVSSLVFDLGTFNHRVGYSGEDSPKYVYQPLIGYDSKNYFFNEYGLRYPNPKTKIFSIMNNQDGTIKDFDLFEKMLNNLLEDGMPLNLSEHPLLFSEPSLHNKTNRTKLTEFMFEKYKIPAIYICKSAVLSGFSCGRSTCLVFDSGHNSTYAVPVSEGYALQKCLIKNNIAGNYITQLVEKVLESKNIKINPFYSFKLKKDGDKFQANYIKTEYEKTYETFWKREIVRDIKETCLIANDEPLDYNIEKDEFIPKGPIPQEQIYDLPDKNTVNLLQERNSILERVFNPINEFPGFSGYHQMVNDAISKADIEIKKDLYSNAFICGGNTLFSGFPERFQKQITNTSKQAYKLKIITLPSNTERKFSSWIGGSILSSLGTFHQLWLSKSEFEEYGANIIERKCA